MTDQPNSKSAISKSAISKSANSKPANSNSARSKPADSKVTSVEPAYSSAAERNSQPIFEMISQLFTAEARVLEIGSGTGQHAVYFCRHLPGLQWQPTDQAVNLPGLNAQFAQAANPQILKPLALDVLHDDWPTGPFDAAYSANTSHIMPWEAVQATFAGVANVLKPGACFCLYGPFNVNGEFTAESNAEFDRMLRAGEGAMGLRDLEDIEKLASSHQLLLERKIAMPANNFILVFRKK